MSNKLEITMYKEMYHGRILFNVMCYTCFWKLVVVIVSCSPFNLPY